MLRKTNPRVKICVNLYENSPFEITNWTIAEETERITIQRGTKKYDIILDEDVPRVEVWNVDPQNDDLISFDKVFDLTEPSNTVYSPEESYEVEAFTELETEESDENWLEDKGWSPENSD